MQASQPKRHMFGIALGFADSVGLLADRRCETF
jgi:hypothetical protein